MIESHETNYIKHSLQSIFFLFTGFLLINVFNFDYAFSIPILIIFVTSILLLSMLINSLQAAILSPFFWFILAYLVYFGFGSLIYIFGSDEAIALINLYFFMDSDLLYKVNLLNYVALTSFLIFFIVFSKVRWIQIFQPKNIPKVKILKICADRFAVIGILFYTLIFITRSSLGEDVTIPGVFILLASFIYGALFIYALEFFRGTAKYKFRFIFLVVFLAIVNLGELSKEAILELLIVLFIAYMLAKPNIAKLFIFSLSGLVLIILMQISFSAARSVIWEQTGNRGSLSTITATSSSNALEIVETATSTISDVGMHPAEFIWIRLSFAPHQAAIINFADSGFKYNTFEKIPWLFLPRIIFPDKPILSIGREITALVSGVETESDNPIGLFTEGYWNYKWFGVFIVAAVVAFFIAAGNQFSSLVYCLRLYTYFPLLFFLIRISYSMDSLTLSYLGSIPFLILIFFICWLCSKRFYIS